MSRSKLHLPRVPHLLAVALLCAAPLLQAAPVGFGIAAATINAGSGYGVDNGSNGENGGTLLDVGFVGNFLAQTFSLANVGDSISFDLATVSFNEPNTGSGGNLGIRGAETDFLDLSVRFDFTAPLLRAIELTATVTANTGAIDDAAVDYAIAWTPVEADFAAGGKFRLSVDALSFTNIGSQTARATVQLLSAPEARVAAVPEPTSLALAGVALAGAGMVRRRRQA